MLKHCSIWLICLLSFSCVSHEDWRGKDAGTNSLRIRITSLPTTRATNGLAENTVREVTYFLFDADGRLEATSAFSNFPDKEVLFEHLTAGKKTLAVLANSTDATCIEPIEIPSGVTKQEFDALTIRMRAPYLFEDPKSIPMLHERELEVPAQNPVVDVALDRLFVRLKLKNDLSNGTFEIDSLTFRNLSGSVNMTNGQTQKAPDEDQTFRPVTDSSVITTYMLPCSAQQVEYSVYGKKLNGPQQIIKGRINPELKKNNSYTMSLSTGEVIEDGTPRNLKVQIDQAVGSYSAADSTIVLGINGGSFSLSAESLDSLEIVSGATWLVKTSTATRAELFPTTFTLTSNQHITSDDTRETTLSIRNKYDGTKNWSLHIRQTGENRGPKYYVVAVAGQSNASGRDMTAYDAKYDQVSPRIFEFGKAGITPPYRGKYDTKSSTLSIVPLHYMAQNLDANIAGGKSLHLPLAKEILKHIPDDYNILVVSAAYSASAFSNPTSSPLGVYDPVEMRPVNFPASLPVKYRIKAREGVMYYLLTDRVKYALELNKRNKFIGVVWLQGESDTADLDTDPHKGFHMFEDFTQAFTEDINSAIPSEQLALGAFSPKMWFNIEQTPGRRYWQDVTGYVLQYARSHYYGGYKIWNFSTFIDIPANTGMNPGDEVHFGQNAFRLIVAPLTVQNMIDNGIFGGKPNTEQKYIRQISASEISAQQGSINDKDIQDRLLAWFPFSDAANIGRNLSNQKDSVSVVNHGLQVVATEGLIGPDKNPRAAKALVLMPNSGQYLEINNSMTRKPVGWSISLMLRRFNGLDNLQNQLLLLVPGTKRGLTYHQYLKESEGGYLTLSFQPAATTYQRLQSVTERLSDANYVRSNEEWVHLTYTFDNASRVCKVYMNGELTMNYTMPAGTTVSDLTRLVLNDAAYGVDAQVRDLCIWDRAISAETAFKVYLLGYYGGDAKINGNIGMGDWEDKELN